MSPKSDKNKKSSSGIPRFDRKFFDSEEEFTFIGNGELGGKAHGLVFIRDILKDKFDQQDFPGIKVSIPTMTVITTDLFDEFMNLNNLHEVAFSDLPDHRIAHAFQNTELPAKIVGDLWALISKVKSPLAVRSSSLLEDALYEPLAGIYTTKMTPNNQFDTETRFAKLVEAIKFVYASTFFKDVKSYFSAGSHQLKEEKMAVIIQEVVGERFNGRYYPSLSGVARSFNYYPVGHAQPEEGVVSLALGLGKSIVDEGIAWSYSPAYPHVNPPYNTISDLMKQSQTEFWCVNMAKMYAYDPVKETEYLVKANLKDAETDDMLRFVASTYDPQSDRIYPGGVGSGPKIINFAPILQVEQLPLNELTKTLLAICEDAIGHPVEVEFAMTLHPKKGMPARFGFLQVRPMVVSGDQVDISQEEMNAQDLLLTSDSVMGNGIVDDLRDIVFVKPENFDLKDSRKIASELESINKKLVKDQRSYLLIGFGRWGSSDPWLGIPVNWGQISGAKVIVEATLQNMNVDLSQGSHFFHNITSFQVPYFSVPRTKQKNINWEWLNRQPVDTELQYVRHVKLVSPLKVKVDGRQRKGIIVK